MKKIVFKSLLLAIMCVGVLGLQKKFMSISSPLSDVMLENVEALTDYELPAVEIVCDSQGWGKCYVSSGLVMEGEYMYNSCQFDGSPYSYCPRPRYH